MKRTLIGKRRYAEAFKRQAVRDIESGKFTVGEIRRRYEIAGSMTVNRWLLKYGRGKVVSLPKKRSGFVAQSGRAEMLERRTRELEQAVARLTVENVALESVIEEAQVHFGIDLKKTFGLGR